MAPADLAAADAVEPPRKRPRRESPAPPARPLPTLPVPVPAARAPAADVTPSQPFTSIAVHTPSYYTPPGAPPTAFQLPLHLTSFSYSPTRELLVGKRKDDAIAHYSEPPLGADLNYGYGDCTWRDDSTDEGLDALLDTLSQYDREDPTGAAADLLGKINVITWRGMMTKLMLAVYEVEGASRGRADGWELNAMVVDGTLYLEEAKSPSKIAKKAASESSYKLQSYYGYSFEAFSTVTPSSPTTPPLFSPPNTNVQWCSVVKTNLGGFRAILGGEVDCVLPSAKMANVTTNDFVELKTNIVIESPRDEMMFERQKLLKHYVQSFLLGVPRVIVGFRTRQGQLSALQPFKTLEIPRLVRGKPHAWDPLACLASARTLLSFLFTQISSAPATKLFQARFDAAKAIDDDAELYKWPVYRLEFSPTGNEPGIRVREMAEVEVTRDVWGAKREERRVGFLLKRWLDDVLRRRIARARPPVSPIVEQNPSAGLKR